MKEKFYKCRNCGDFVTFSEISCAGCIVDIELDAPRNIVNGIEFICKCIYCREL